MLGKNLWIRASFLVVFSGLLGAGCVIETSGAASGDGEGLRNRCGAELGPDCPRGTYCRGEDGLCPNEGHAGSCELRPTVCTREYAPVCGCDGQTYGNRCEAEAAGASVARDGTCDDDVDACATVRCGAGTHCEVTPDGAVCVPDDDAEPVTCGSTVCAPGEVCCNASCGICTPPDGACIQVACEPDPNEPVRCGGIAGIVCPGAGVCVDDPSDNCDPSCDGADCGGLCDCSAVALCKPGYTWDGSPAVCACVPNSLENPCAAVLCRAGTLCEVTEEGSAKCVPIPPRGEPCGRTVCGDGQVCCNASCGICTPPDGACIQIACEEVDDD